MKITVTARHMDVTEVMKEYAVEKAERLEKFFDNIRKVEIILDAERNKRYSAEMIVSAARGQVLVCHTTDSSATAALDIVLDKMERQLTKFKEKLREKHNGEAGRRGLPRPEPELSAGDNFGDLWW